MDQVPRLGLNLQLPSMMWAGGAFKYLKPTWGLIRLERIRLAVLAILVLP